MSLHPENAPNPLIGIIMGSQSDWETMKLAYDKLHAWNIAVEAQIVSAHRTPEAMFDYAKAAKGRGLKLIIAGAGGAAHLPGMVASLTPLPVIGVPMESAALKGLDSLLSIVQMPKGSPVATMAIGKPGAESAAVYALQILALHISAYEKLLEDYLSKKRDIEPRPRNPGR